MNSPYRFSTCIL